MASKESAIFRDDTGSPNSESVESGVDVAGERALLRKIDVRVLPTVSFLYLLSFLDRSNVANAKIEGLAEALHMTGNQYLTGLTLYFVGYVLFEIPCNIVLKRTTPKFWLPTLTIVWGVVATLIGIVQNLAGFFVVRFFLGVAESGLFPGVVFYLSYWYKRNERQYRVALFFSMASLAGAFGGILAYGIAHMDGVGDYEGWRWIFILEGIFTVLVGALAYLLITNAPTTARWLNETEKSVIHSRLQADSDCTQNEGFTWGNVMAAFKDIKCWLYCFAFHTMSLPLYTLSLFLPTIITALGYTAATAQLLTVPPYAVACLLTVAIAIISARFKSRAPFLIGSSSLAIIGYIILLANRNPTARPGLSYAGAFLAAAGIYPSVALSLSYPAVNVSGQTKRAVANAMQISIGNLGAVLGTQLYRANDGPRYIVGHSFALAYLVGNCIVASAIWFVLTRENRQKEVVLAQEGKTESSKDLVWNGDQDARWKFET